MCDVLQNSMRSLERPACVSGSYHYLSIYVFNNNFPLQAAMNEGLCKICTQMHEDGHLKDAHKCMGRSRNWEEHNGD